ncbi:anti-sigma F factor [Paenisporosarcina cavernae]|uniref:Anti-sigma F factor n=1 Tax=Paenisporosarcina cavernae TaxID=2320858 RepID=A0A385YRX1_9BACL|nr:anti-sigma F factor [Paenisporosarcina cavernae]AYC29346.1 anti-sigma F factor [Paenisporosarcina cavernae]
MENEMTLSFIAKTENERLARMVITSFLSTIDPTVEELSECKTILSEAVTNAIIHGYQEDGKGVITVSAKREGRMIEVVVSDQGSGIENLELAKEPLYTTKVLEERSGMGFTIMETFADEFQVETAIGKGTVVRFKKVFQAVRPLTGVSSV